MILVINISLNYISFRPKVMFSVLLLLFSNFNKILILVVTFSFLYCFSCISTTIFIEIEKKLQINLYEGPPVKQTKEVHPNVLKNHKYVEKTLESEILGVSYLVNYTWVSLDSRFITEYSISHNCWISVTYSCRC